MLLHYSTCKAIKRRAWWMLCQGNKLMKVVYCSNISPLTFQANTKLPFVTQVCVCDQYTGLRKTLKVDQNSEMRNRIIIIPETCKMGTPFFHRVVEGGHNAFPQGDGSITPCAITMRPWTRGAQSNPGNYSLQKITWPLNSSLAQCYYHQFRDILGANLSFTDWSTVEIIMPL